MRKRLVFPKDAVDLLAKLESKSEEAAGETATDGTSGTDSNVSEVFFELANTDEIAFEYTDEGENLKSLIFRQDRSACGKHTGGIIWETAYVLLQYLLEQSDAIQKRGHLGDVVELGAGVGFLGQCLAAARCARSVTLTDTAEVIVHTKTTLEKNERNLPSTEGNATGCCITASELDWIHCERDIEALVSGKDHNRNGTCTGSLLACFDTILSTDVLFAPHLVEPLLKTASRLWKDNVCTVWFLCVQVRCAKSHQLFLDRCPEFGFHIEDLSSNLNVMGRSMECCLFRITRTLEEQRHSAPKKKQRTMSGSTKHASY